MRELIRRCDEGQVFVPLGVMKLIGRGVLISSRGREESEDAAAEFFGLEAQCGSVEGARHDPQFLAASRGGVNHLRMAARQCDVLFIANKENGECAGSDCFYGRYFGDGKAGEFFVAIEQRPSSRSKESFSEPGIFSETGVIVSRFAKIGEGGFGDDSFDTRISSCGLQHDSRAHGFAKGEDVE